MVTYTIKIYYTPEMRKSVKNIATMVENVVAQTNQGYEDSKNLVRVKLHCMEETNLLEAMINDLGVFTKYKEGRQQSERFRRCGSSSYHLFRSVVCSCQHGRPR